MTRDGLQTKLQHVLLSVKKLCDAVKPPSKDPAAKKVPRAMEDEEVPFIADDPTSDAIVATFCGGTFRDDLIPVVRTWVDLQSQSSPAQLRSFVECFSTLGRFNLDQEQSKVKSTATSERLARNVTNRLTRRSSKRLSSPNLARPLTLLKTLYGPKLSSYASETLPLVESAEFLRGIQAFYLVADPKANPLDDREKVIVTEPGSGSKSRTLLPIPDVEIEMSEFPPPPTDWPPPPRASTPPPIPPLPEGELEC